MELWYAVFSGLSMVLSIGFPLVLFLYVILKRKSKIRYIFAGAMIFAVFQLVLRIPLVTFLQGQFWFYANIASNKVIMALFLSITAGIFEEIGRYVAFKFFNKYEPTNWDVFSYGVGHGGFESIALIGINTIFTFIALLYINFGLLGGFVESLPGIFTESSNWIEVLSNTPPHMFLMGGIERVFAVLLHIALSFVVAESVFKKRPKLLLVAILIHGAVNFVAVMMPNVYLSEIFLLIVAFFSVLYIKSRFKVEKGS
ncbi:YhfC family intramembrane metalloprotease [Alkalibacter mobilis]|uniref:YhfC family intramembrane metalloprotease n=1 Tax=Alkalibacter mobilis TaxID=2787712 RepID=UPI00189F0D31|nr:YhfC family glutamic-type intramembrane protease [Alkalibacter mobilis]MBF7097268.1 YhfC family intramembrane metalloprotease [Alkalibacter mobilis]